MSEPTRSGKGFVSVPKRARNTNPDLRCDLQSLNHEVTEIIVLVCIILAMVAGTVA